MALAGVYANLAFDVVDDEVLRDLVIARVVEPTTLRKAVRRLTHLRWKSDEAKNVKCRRGR